MSRIKFYFRRINLTMAGVKRSSIRVNMFFSRFGLIRIFIFLLLVTGTFQLPIPFHGGAPFALPHSKNPGFVDPKALAGEKFFRFIMKPQFTPETDLSKESKDSVKEYQYQEVPNAFTTASEDKANDDIYTDTLNQIDMDILSKDEGSDVTLLSNISMPTPKVNHDAVIVKWNNSSIPDNWWTVCQVPVLIIVFGIIGVCVISLIVVLWFKRQMSHSSKDSDGNSNCNAGQHVSDDNVSNSEIINGTDNDKAVDRPEDKQPAVTRFTFPSPGEMIPEEQLVCHTTINLKGSDEGATAEAVQVQLQDTPSELLMQTAKEVEKKPEGLKPKAKGLLERRGSSASLTIDLTQNTFDNKLSLVTPPEESCEEYLLSAGNMLSRAQLKIILNNVQAVHSEFWEIPSNHPEKSEVTGSGMKNRYETILPNERTRVKLVTDSENPLDGYINANYIRGYDGEEKAYIATQGPLSNTIQDLYHMAWNEKSPIIVMITKLLEKAKIKCESYFPMDTNESLRYGDYDVTVISIKPKQGYTVRELLVKKNEETRLIMHYWYDTWPDHKTPENAHTIVTMAEEIEKLRLSLKNSTCPENLKEHNIFFGPVIVHCSAGIGRTGCFIAISVGMTQLKLENQVDILGIVCQMRYDRGGMIQTAEQYEFVYNALTFFAESLPEAAGN